MDLVAILIAKYLFLAPIVILGGYFLWQPWETKKRMVLFAIPSLLLTYGIGLLGNRLYLDPRPFVVTHSALLVPHLPDNGFPSDHALLLAALAALANYWNRRLGLVLWTIALVVGAARVYLGLHHPIDIVGSIVIAAVAATATYGVLHQLRNKNGRPLASKTPR